MSPQLHEGFVLHQRPYRETSALIEIFTRDFGRIALVGRGVRGVRGKRQTQAMTAFRPYLFAWAGQGELQTLRQAEPDGQVLALTGDALFAGFYANELLIRLCTRHDPHPALYAAYLSLLQSLSQGRSVDVSLRYFERDLLSESGYGLHLEYDAQSGAAIEPALRYAYLPESGPVLSTASDSFAGSTLLALAAGDLQSEPQRQEAKRLLRRELQALLGERPLQSLQTMRRMRQMSMPRPRSE